MNSPSLPAAASRTRVLVVDDITKNLQVVGTMLRNAGYEIMLTTSGAQALERVRAQPPDLILLDLMMPEMDGKVWCESEPGKGATFIVELPVDDSKSRVLPGN